MEPLATAQYMAAASLFTVALIHGLVWSRRPRSDAQLLFALAAVAAGGNAIAESCMYRAMTVDTMAVALKWYVAMSGLWIIALVWFIVAYTGVGKLGRWLAVGLSMIFFVALAINYVAPFSFLFTEIRGLRLISLPWGEQIRLADGRDSPWRLGTEAAILGILFLVVLGCSNLWRKGQRTRAGLLGTSVVLFVACFGTHAFLVDTGRLNSPYLSTYGFLIVVLVMGYDLAGRVMEASQLAARLKQQEAELRAAVAEERSRIAGDLHDSVTQTLFSTAAIADALPEVWTRYPEEAHRGLDDLRQLTKGALAEMRALLLELRPAALLEKSLGELLVQLADATVARTRIPVRAEVTCDRPLPEDVQIGLYRVAQEALNNVIKHAQASKALLGLRGDSDGVILTISDDGCGFVPQSAEPGRLGLPIMRERVRTMGASLDIESTAGEGTTVKVVWSDTPR
jgi:signal transduction histidine kinase